MINRTPDAKAKIMKLPNSAGTSEDGSSSRNSTITGTSCSESMGSSPALSSSSPSSLHAIQGYNTLDNSFMLNNSILEFGESDSGSDGGENVSQKFGRYDSSDDEAETDLIKSLMESSISQRKPGVMNSKNAEANHKDAFLFSVDAQKIPINARNLPLLEQQSHESHDVLIHGSSTTSTNNESMTDPITLASTISIRVEATDETVLTKESVKSTATNQHLDEDHKYFYFDSAKVLKEIPDSSENLVEWQNCVTVTGKTRHQRVFPEFKNGVEVFANGEKVALFRYHDKVYAMKTQCPHRKGPIQMGDIEDVAEHGPCVVCPWHRWTFKLNTGQLVKPENRSGKNNDLQMYPVQLRGPEQKIFVGFANFSKKVFDGADDVDF
eukprot:g14515.t1